MVFKIQIRWEVSFANMVNDSMKEKIKQDGIVMVMNKHLSKKCMSNNIDRYMIACIEYKL